MTSFDSLSVTSAWRDDATPVSTSRLIRVYADRELFVADHPPVLMLQPFWGAPPDIAGDPSSGRFAQFLRRGQSLFVLAAPESADIHLFPNVYDHVAECATTAEHLECFQHCAVAHRKPAVIFDGSDSDGPFPFAELEIFRPSIQRPQRRRREFATPVWSEDFVECYLGGGRYRCVQSAASL